MTDNILMFLTLGWIIYIHHWLLTIPLSIAAFLIGLKSRFWAVWFLIFDAGGYILLPALPNAARHEDAMIYMALPFLIPFYVLVPFGLGQLMRWWRSKRNATVYIG